MYTVVSFVSFVVVVGSGGMVVGTVGNGVIVVIFADSGFKSNTWNLLPVKEIYYSKIKRIYMNPDLGKKGLHSRN